MWLCQSTGRPPAGQGSGGRTWPPRHPRRGGCRSHHGRFASNRSDEREHWLLTCQVRGERAHAALTFIALSDGRCRQDGCVLIHEWAGPCKGRVRVLAWWGAGPLTVVAAGCCAFQSSIRSRWRARVEPPMSYATPSICVAHVSDADVEDGQMRDAAGHSRTNNGTAHRPDAAVVDGHRLLPRQPPRRATSPARPVALESPRSTTPFTTPFIGGTVATRCPGRYAPGARCCPGPKEAHAWCTWESTCIASARTSRWSTSTVSSCFSRRLVIDPARFRELLGELGEDARFALEATYGWEWLAELLEGEGRRGRVQSRLGRFTHSPIALQVRVYDGCSLRLDPRRRCCSGSSTLAGVGVSTSAVYAGNASVRSRSHRSSCRSTRATPGRPACGSVGRRRTHRTPAITERRCRARRGPRSGEGDDCRAQAL
jgi:hypothetical protein